ncbi:MULTISPECIES: hypothetical protein [Agrobacterium]|uniref:Uncharacterized protein n=1 Tax=Agrobacterium larrymoorei TaxID=160699 RepID=A0ABX8THZ5_9HYPH|nr:hypothetical protein [Agrobacterium larrymoorei]NSZ10090.1 hypothetical protein [Agrobacterium tumefaciens]QYA10820.1 hypothetical protein J5285_26055 [Agrobacterium larrymoorei]
MTRKTVHLIAGLHITATDKRHILGLVDKGWQRGWTRRKFYEITERKENTLRVLIESKESNDLGRPIKRRSRVTVEIRGAAANV